MNFSPFCGPPCPTRKLGGRSAAGQGRRSQYGGSHEIALVAALPVRAQGHDCRVRHRRCRPDRMCPHGRGHDEAASGSDDRQSAVEDSDPGARQRHGALRFRRDLRISRPSARRREAFPGAVRRADDGAAPPGAGRRAARRPGPVARRAFAAGGAAVAALSQELFRAQRGHARRARARSAGARIRAPIRSVMSRSDARFVIWTSGLPTGNGAGIIRSWRGGTRHLRPAPRSVPPSPSTTPKPRCGPSPRPRPSP